MSSILSSLDDFDLGGNSRSRILSLHDIVDAVSVSQIVNEINKINEEDHQTERELAYQYDITNYKRKPIYLDISTPGGSVYDGLVLVSVIEQSKTPIITRIQGYAFSFGLTLLLAGHERHVSRHASLMYHQILTEISGPLKGIEESLAISKEMQERLENYVIEKTKFTKERLNKIYRQKKDVYIYAEEALELGIATKII